jgi:ADP-dependent NAD(P)H-hydrate dehydratase
MNDVHHGCTALNPECLRQWPLPMPEHEGDKEQRGRLLVIAGAREMPGTVMLAAEAAFRAGAGKVTIATCASIASGVALAIPEARVIALPETSAGDIRGDAADAFADLGRPDAVLIGPGMQDEDETHRLTDAVGSMFSDVPFVLDANAMGVVTRKDHGFTDRALVTPHAGEMAHLRGCDKSQVLADPWTMARDASRQWRTLVALKGAITYIATTEGTVWRHDAGNIGLAASGSGDVLAGIIAGLAARGAPLEQAAAWGVSLHARAGERLAEHYGLMGYLARELGAEVPALMQALRPKPAGASLAR